LRILLASLNSKYVHTNLAIRYLRESVFPEFPKIELREFTINEPIERIAAEIYEAKADVIGFSCYIWNLSETIALIRQLRPVCPNVRILVGGPEVSYDAARFLQEHSELDAVVFGEGEVTFLELLRAWRSGMGQDEVKGLAWRENGEIRLNSPRQQVDFECISNPYQQDEDFTGRLVYVETTRGCPFNCQYCLSSTFQGVRFISPEKFRGILKQLLRCGARTIKFVDRTFNVDKKHAFEILDIVREETANYPPDAGIRAHCEIAGELLDGEWIEFLRDYPKDLVQFEIGVQSTNPETLAIISRPQHFERWSKYVQEIQGIRKTHLHLDLIAGLPEEDWKSFRNSFNEVYAVQPDMLQLGFLKVLKGSGLREKSEKYGLVYSPDPPYTILQNRVLSHEELLKLHRLEEILDRYYNSGRFSTVLPHVVKEFSTPFDFYLSFADYWQMKGWFRQNWSGKALFEKLWEFFITRGSEGYQQKEQEGVEATGRVSQNSLRELLRFDYYLWERPSVVPNYLLSPLESRPQDYNQVKLKIQQDLEWANQIPEIQRMDRRQWSRATAVEYFTYPQSQWVLFYYNQGQSTAYPHLKGAIPWD
jgi:anaerobic magnesium-protoporphyrin IX monomethyl ester cyclase